MSRLRKVRMTPPILVGSGNSGGRHGPGTGAKMQSRKLKVSLPASHGASHNRLSPIEPLAGLDARRHMYVAVRADNCPP
jgi:hypothetical protein